jgi:glutamate synthase (NADPH/NADH) small chain
MGKITGFLEIERQDRTSEKPEVRINNYNEFVQPLPYVDVSKQAARCMDCGIPFCHQGCPVNNQIPDWNNLVYRDQWRTASENLHTTNNFPEFTGRICPAPCEASCTLNIIDSPVTIKTIECQIVDRAWDEGWIQPQVAPKKTGKTVAVVGSGPAGMAAAQQLARAGHSVTVFEKADRVGGLLRYGIPDFKMEKGLIDRRIAQMQAEGVEFRLNQVVGAAPVGAGNGKVVPVDPKQLLAEFDAVVLAGGAEQPRDLPIPGRELDGVHFAMNFLPLQNRRVAGDAKVPELWAKGKHVVVIGGGDTGSDCVGTSNRHGAASVSQFELMPMPPDPERNPVWPYWPTRLRTSSSHEEGAKRDWSIATKEFVGENGKVKSLKAVRLEWEGGKMREVPGSEFTMQADLVLLAMGFVSPWATVCEAFGVDKDARGNAAAATEGAKSYATSVPKVFAAGDMRRGQSLVVWAIREGRQCARAVDEALMGRSDLPR